MIKPTKAKFVLFQGRSTRLKRREWYFHLKASNGKIICQSEGYKRKSNALKGIESIKRFASKAKIVEL